MNSDFIVTGIKRVIFIDKTEYTEPVIRFTNQLDSHELILHLSGACTVIFNEKRLECPENTIRFLPKGENREYTVYGKSAGECIDIFFDTNLPISPEAFVINLKSNFRASLFFKKLFSVWVAKNEGWYFECISLLYKILSEMQKENYLPEKQYNAILPAVSYIEQNFLKGKFSIADLSKLCKISPSYMKELFVKRFGVPPVKYIIRLKINHACDLLLSGNFSVSRTAEICGYDNVHFFSRQFKEYMGVSPMEFKNKYKSSK